MYPFEVEKEVDPQGTGHDYAYTAEALKEERDAVWVFVKRLGTSFLEGKDLVSVSMPVTLCEPATFLERMCRGWVTMPYYCDLIDKETREAEKMKLVAAMVISGLHLNTACKKPFNPLLGETYDAVFEDGTTIHNEQTSHHPPVSSWEVIPPSQKWKFHGTAKWSGYFAGNQVQGGQLGMNYLTFSNGYEVNWELPGICVSGVLTGNRILDHVGSMTIRDNSSPPLVCKVGFGDQRHMMQKMSDGSKWLAGAMTMGLFGNSDSEVVKQDDELSGSIAIESSNGNDSEKLILSRVAGSWLKGVDFTDTDTKKTQRYWLREKTQITKLDNTVPENPLPTDARIRKDLLALKDGNFDLAQEHKEAIEVEQRRIAKLRKK